MNTIKSLKISISGVRGVVGESLTPQLLVDFAQAFGTYVRSGRIVIGRDTRPSGEMVRNAVVGGLLATGCEVVDVGVCPVPTIQLAVERLAAAGGIAITASHNPEQWNALKFIRSDGIFLNSYQAEELLEVYHQGQFRMASARGLGRVRFDPTAADAHIQAVLDLVDADAIRAARIRVALDCCNGAGSEVTPRLLDALGCQVHAINVTPDGRFPHPPEPVPDNLGQLAEAVKQSGAQVGFAQDADADRLALVDENGHPPGEDYTLALACDFLAPRHDGPIVVNLSASRMIDDIAKKHGRRCIRTPIGEVNVAERMKREGGSCGGEGNGGVIVPALHYCRDSLIGIAVILQSLAESREPLTSLMQRFPAYHIVKSKIEVPSDRIPHALKHVVDAHEGEDLDLTDGVKINWPDSWLHVRRSNTEPVIRVIAEAPTPDRAQRLCDEALAQIAAAG
jgi:phosphomannomutase